MPTSSIHFANEWIKSNQSKITERKKKNNLKTKLLKEMAEALKVSKSAIYQLSKIGMPRDSIAAASTWLRQNPPVRRKKRWAENAAEICGVTENQIKNIIYTHECVPRSLNCFYLYFVCHKRSQQVRRAFSAEYKKLQTERTNEGVRARYKIKYSNDPEYRAKKLGSYKVAMLNPETKAKRLKSLRKWRHKKYCNDSTFRILSSVRSRIWKVMKRSLVKKNFKTHDIIGCSPHFLKQWLESKFTGGMSWENYGTHWHMDHIRPLVAFDMTDSSQLKQAWHYTNLQPLEALENMRKGSKVFDERLRDWDDTAKNWEDV